MAILLLWGGVVVVPIHAQEEVSITYERYDVEITVAADGSFRVREIQQIRFDDAFSSAFAEIPLAYTSNITDVLVYEGETIYQEDSFGRAPGTYTVDHDSDTLVVEWGYDRTRPGTVKTFTVEYTVEGGLWVYEDEYTLEWRAIPGDRSGIIVENASVVVHLPNSLAPGELHFAAFGAEYEATTVQGEVRFNLEQPLPDGAVFQVLVGFPKAGITAEKQPYQIQEEQATLAYRFESLDVDLFINPDGRVVVEEAHRVSVSQGLLRQGERTIPLAYTDGITNVQVFEGEIPLTQSITLCEDCFTVSEHEREEWIRYDEESDQILIREGRAGQAEIRWAVPALVPGEATTFRLRYEVPGLILGDESGQRFDWNAVFDTRRMEQVAGDRVDLQGTPPIENATVQVHLPDGIAPESITIEGGTVVSRTDGTIEIHHDGAIAPGEAWEIQVNLPPNATTAPTPQWQMMFEAARQAQTDAATRFAQRQFGLGAGGVITFVGGLVGTFLLWFTRGRDKEVPLQAEFLSEPPSSLPPGIVAYLVDEKPTTKGVMASLFQLAGLGLVRITFNQGFQIQRNLQENELYEGQEIARSDGTTIAIPTHLVTVYNAIAARIPTEAATRLDNVYPHFVQVLPRVYEQMGEEASQFFSEIPTKSAFRWKSLGQGLILVGLVGLGIAYFGFREEWGDVVLWIPGALAIVGVAFWVVSRWMAQKTMLGAEEASKWQAFQRYLQKLNQYGSLAEAQKILDEHFAYAVALDVEKVVLQQATEMGTTAPIWTFPTTIRRDSPLPPRDPIGQRPQQLPPLRTMPNRPTTSPGLPPAALPERDWSVQGTSDSMATAITGADRSLAALLSQAGGVDDGTTPFDVVRSGVEGVTKTTFSATKSTFEVLGEILESASSGGGGGGYSSGGSTWRSSSRSSSGSWNRSSSSSSSSRSSSRRSGGGGSRGFR